MAVKNKDKDQLVKEVQELRERVRELEQYRDQLHYTNQMWNTLMENTPDLVYFKDANHGIIQASRSYAQAVGATAEEDLIGKTAIDLWPNEGKEIIADEQSVLAGKAMVRKEREVTTAAGELRWYLLTKIPIYQDRDIIGFFAMDKDITERKRAEKALEESESRFRRIYESNMIGIAYWDQSRRITNANQVYLDMIGYSHQEILSGNVKWSEITPDEYQEKDQTAMREIKREGFCSPYEKEYIRKDGSRIPVLLGGAALEGEEHLGITFAIDISERKQAEIDLQDSEQKLRNIVEYSTNLFYMHTPDNVLTYISPQSRHFLQCEPEEAMVRWTEFVSDHPANREGMQHTEKAIRTGQRQPPYELEIIGKKGKRVWVEVNEAPLVEDAKTVAIIGSLTDITERKQATQQNEERRMYLESVLNAAPDAIVTLDADQKIVEWNPGARILFGYTAEEAVGKMLDDLITSEKVIREARAYSEQVRKGGDIPPTEVVRYRKDGSQVEVIMAGSPIIVDNHVIGAVGVYTDISDRVRMEEALRTMALRDDLTGLYNRRGFTLLADQHIKIAQREKKNMILLYADVDRLKDINDTFGHPFGDQALKDTSQSLKSTFRKSDIIARVGGDEFVVLAMENAQSSPENLTHRLQKQINSLNKKQKRDFELSISIGWVYYDHSSPCSLDQLINQADQAMYNEKKNGQNDT